MTSELTLLRAIISHQGIEYAACDAEWRIVEHSPGLLELVTATSGAQLKGQRIADLFDELQGIEEELQRVARGESAHFQIVHTYRERRGRACYITLSVLAYPPGLLLLASDTTQEAQLAQRLMQQRNEMMLLQARLKESNERLDYLLRHFVPASVARQLMTQRDLPRLGGQQRTISVLFADIRGYTSLAEKMEPPAVMNLLNRHFATIGGLVVEHGGAISQYSGDMIMAIFNAPEDQPDHALRAVRAALEVQAAIRMGMEVMDILCAQDKPSDVKLPLIVQFGIGINTGPAVVGYLGFEDRFDYTAIGDTTNVASRMSTAAQAGQVLIGPQTYEAVRKHIRTRQVGPLHLKGKAAPLMVYEAVE